MTFNLKIEGGKGTSHAGFGGTVFPADEVASVEAEVCLVLGGGRDQCAQDREGGGGGVGATGVRCERKWVLGVECQRPPEGLGHYSR